jgi:hypothetical protein
VCGSCFCSAALDRPERGLPCASSLPHSARERLQRRPARSRLSSADLGSLDRGMVTALRRDDGVDSSTGWREDGVLSRGRPATPCGRANLWTPSRSARCSSRSTSSSSSRASTVGDGPHPSPDAGGPARSNARGSGGGIARCGVIGEALRKLVGDLDACASLAARSGSACNATVLPDQVQLGAVGRVARLRQDLVGAGSRWVDDNLHRHGSSRHTATVRHRP